MDINFELYKVFYHTARAGSFSGAAEKMFITQSAVSQAIKNLEEKTGSRLFHRKTRSVKLTQEGELLYKHVEQAFNFIKTAESKLNEMQNLHHGEIRIGVGDTICKYFLLRYLEKFSQIYPKIKIQVINRTSQQILDILKNGQVDLGIVTLPVNDPGIRVEEFLTVEDVFVASDKYTDLINAKIKLEELLNYPLLLLNRESATRRNLDAYLGQKGIRIYSEVELESVDLLVEFARIGLGVAHVLKQSAKEAVSRRELYEIKTDEPLPSRRLGIAVMKDMPLSRAAGEFIKSLKL